MRVCVIKNNIVHNIIVLDLVNEPDYVYPGAFDLLVPDDAEDRAIGDVYDPNTGAITKPQPNEP
jgi:hypothetical protein